MPLDLLSSIKGASSSAAVNELFKVIQQAIPAEDGTALLESGDDAPVSLDELRSDEIVRSTQTEKEIIRQNFPGEKNGYLVVPKVIED